jgi:hypothetical protein
VIDTAAGVVGRTRRRPEWLHPDPHLVLRGTRPERSCASSSSFRRVASFGVLAERKSYFRSLGILLLEGVPRHLA